jgi:hypothetical protein
VLIETSPGFVAAESLKVLFRLGAAMRKAVGRGYLLGLAPFSALSLGAQIDNGAHKKIGGNWIAWQRPFAADLSAMITPIRGQWITVDRYPRDTKMLSPRYRRQTI